MVALGVVLERGFGHLCDLREERAQVGRAGDLRAVGRAENEVAEAEVVEQVAAQLLDQGRRELAHEARPEIGHAVLDGVLGRLDQDRHVGVDRTHALHELQPRLRLDPARRAGSSRP